MTGLSADFGQFAPCRERVLTPRPNARGVVSRGGLARALWRRAAQRSDLRGVVRGRAGSAASPLECLPVPLHTPAGSPGMRSAASNSVRPPMKFGTIIPVQTVLHVLWKSRAAGGVSPGKRAYPQKSHIECKL